jgi:hypothetical protein
MGARQERAEQWAIAAQGRAGAAPHNLGVQSPGYVQVPAGMHPDHDEAVTFVPGEMMPRWAAEALLHQRPEPDEHGVDRRAGSARRGRKS